MAEGPLLQCWDALTPPPLQPEVLTMTGLQDALLWCQTFVDQCRTGKNAELRLMCEDGRLKVNVFADLGPFRAQTVPETYFGGQKVGNSRLRRTERRAAAKFAADDVSATKAAAGVELNGVKAAEEAATKKAAVEEAAKKAAAEEAAKKAAQNCDVAVTSCLGSKPASSGSCWNCGEAFSNDHQCDFSPAKTGSVNFDSVTESGTLSDQKLCGQRPSPSAPVVLKKPIRMLDGSLAFPPRRK